MKPIDELLALSQRSDKRILIYELSFRRSQLKRLLQVSDVDFVSPEQTHSMQVLRDEIQKLRSHIHWLDDLKPMFDAGYKAGRDKADYLEALEHSRRVKGAQKANATKDLSREWCIDQAREWWKKEVESGNEVTRIGEVSEVLYRRLESERMWRPTKSQRVREWLKTAGADGLIVIPEQARQPGRPKTTHPLAGA